MTYKATLTTTQVDPKERPYNTIIRISQNVWGENEYYEPDGFPLYYDNVEALARDPDARSRYGLGLFEVNQNVQDSCIGYSLGRFVWFAGEKSPRLIDSVQVGRIASCLERHGFTLRFAYDDETEIDYDRNFQTFCDLMMGPPPGYSILERPRAIDLPVYFLEISADEGDAA